MKLLQLPPEILARCMEHLDFYYFREDLGRLTVCKQWFVLAQAAFLTNVGFSPTTLRCLFSSQDARPTLSCLKDNLKEVSITMRGYEKWPIVEDVDSDGEEYYDHTIREAIRHTTLRGWTTDLDEDLRRLAAMTGDCVKLRIVRIEAFSEISPTATFPTHRDYLFAPSLSALLSAKNLTVLDLDTCGSTLQRYYEGDEIHICEVVGGLLVNLRKLRLRMRNICPHALNPKTAIHTRLVLSEVLVKLSLPYESFAIGEASSSKRCGVSSGENHKLQTDMEAQAQTLVPSMSSPRIVQILANVQPNGVSGSFNALTGKHVLVDGEKAWEDFGKVVDRFRTEAQEQCA